MTFGLPANSGNVVAGSIAGDPVRAASVQLFRHGVVLLEGMKLGLWHAGSVLCRAEVLS